MWNARLLAGTEQNTLKEGVVDLQLQHFVRVGLQVAEAVAAAIEEQEDRKYRPVLLRIQSGEKGESPEYRFEGGTVVQVNMLDMDQFTEYWRKPHREQWVVTHCNVRYWKGSDVSYGLAQRREEGKISEIWGPEKLLEIKEQARFRSWIQDRFSIQGHVMIVREQRYGQGFWFWEDEDHRPGVGYEDWGDVPYFRFRPGDLEMVKSMLRVATDVGCKTGDWQELHRVCQELSRRK